MLIKGAVLGKHIGKPFLVVPCPVSCFNPISSGVSKQREAPGGGLGDPPYLIPVKQKIEISALVQWHIYSK